MKYLFTTLLLISLSPAKAQFRDSFKRYLSGHDALRIFFQKFPDAKVESIVDCSALQSSNRTILGDPNPANGEIVYPTVSTGYVNWYVKCINQMVDRQYDSLVSNPIKLQKYVGSSTNLNTQSPWNSLGAAEKNKIVSHLPKFYIGPGIVVEEPALINKVVNHLNTSAKNIQESLKTASMILVLQEEFVCY